MWECRTARAVSVVVVIGPPNAQPVLPGLLNPRGAVSPLPVLPLGREEDVARGIASDRIDRMVNQLLHFLEAGLVIFEMTVAQSQ